MRQKTELEITLHAGTTGEAPSADAEGTEARAAKTELESRAAVGPSMEAIVERVNLKKALARVKRNKGASGLDGMTIDELVPYLKEHWPRIRAQLLDGSYKPQPVRRVEIPKASGGKRPLGIPTVLDRFIQQAVMQVLQADWDRTFSAHSYGFRPQRSAHQAVARAQELIASGHDVVVDIDLEKFFDRVNHDILMGLVAKRVTDKRVLKLIRGFLTTGGLADGLVGPTEEGTPQGGPLSPLLSNLMLDVLDKELETRGLNFVRYADDCNIYVRSQRAGARVMAGVEGFLTRRLKLKVNKAKSAVARPSKRKFLGFSFMTGKQPRRRIAPQSLAQFRSRVRERGCAPSRGSNGNAGLLALPSCDAAASAGIWRRRAPVARMALGGSATAPRSPSLFRMPSSSRSGSPLSRCARSLHPSNRRVRTRMHGGVGGGGREADPYPDCAFANRLPAGRQAQC